MTQNNMIMMDAEAFTSHDGAVIFLPLLLTKIRRTYPALEDENIETIVSSVLAENQKLRMVLVDGSLDESDTMAEILLKELVSRLEIGCFVVMDTLQASTVPNLLRRCILPHTKTKSKFCIQLVALRMTASQAEAIFTELLTIPCRLSLVIFWESCDEGLVDSFSRYLSDARSCLCSLTIGWSCQEGPDYLQESELLLRTTCDAISKSPTMESLRIWKLPAHNGRSAEYIARAIATSSTLVQFRIDEEGEGNLTMNQVQQALAHTKPVRNMDLLYKCSSSNNTPPQLEWTMTLERTTCSFKQLLPKHAPLGLWPTILVQADNCNRYDSHSSLDFLYLLVREKNDILLQNVRSRRLRNRSSYTTRLWLYRFLKSMIPR